MYREVLEEDLSRLTDINRLVKMRRILSVLTKNEVGGLLAKMEGVTALLALLLHDTDMRLIEGMIRVVDASVAVKLFAGMDWALRPQWPIPKLVQNMNDEIQSDAAT